jgi:hypothetical protein
VISGAGLAGDLVDRPDEPVWEESTAIVEIVERGCFDGRLRQGLLESNAAKVSRGEKSSFRAAAEAAW